MSSKQYGLAYERKRKKMLELEGYMCHRSRGSFGGFDIIATNKDHLLLESIKSTKQEKYYPNSEIAKLQTFTAVPPGTIRRLVVFVKGKMTVMWESREKTFDLGMK